MTNRYASIVLKNAEGLYATLKMAKPSTHPYRFPGGKIDAGETALQAAARELNEELGVEALSLRYFSTEETLVDGNIWIGDYFICDNWRGNPTNREPAKHEELEWVPLWKLDTIGANPEFEVARAYLLEENPMKRFDLFKRLITVSFIDGKYRYKTWPNSGIFTHVFGLTPSVADPACETEGVQVVFWFRPLMLSVALNLVGPNYHPFEDWGNNVR